MTQKYTPTDNDVKEEYVRAFCSARNERHWSDNSIKGERAFNCWLAAHDAEVRDKALTLTDDELAIAEGAYESSIMEYEDDGIEAMSIALDAVAKDRRSHEYCNR